MSYSPHLATTAFTQTSTATAATSFACRLVIRGMLLAAAVLVAIAVMGPSRASAYTYTTDPDYWKQTQGHRDTAYRLIYSQSPQTIPPAYDPVLEAEEILRSQQRTLPPSNPAARRIWRGIRTTGRVLRPGLRSLGELGLAFAATEVLWRVGSKLFHIGAPASPALVPEQNTPRIRFFAQGESFPLFFKHQMPYDGWAYSTFSQEFSYQTSYEYFVAPTSSPHSCALNDGPGAPFESIIVPAAPYACGGSTQLVSHILPEDALDATGPVEDYTGQPYDRSTTPSAAPSQTTTESSINTELAKPDNRTLRDWLNYKLGSPGQTDPTGIGPQNPYPVDLPTCLGAAFAACTQQLRDAGLTGTITRSTLSQDDAVMEEDADRVTAIYPGGGVQSDTEVTVYVNPTTMPTMTPTETLVADQITQNNPDVDPDPETHAPRLSAKTIARRCVKAVGLAGVASLTALDCGRLPIFITGYDAVGAAVTNLQAIVNKPRWVLLHRRAADQEASGDRQWYNRVEAGPTCRDAARAVFRSTYGYSAECDEYPFYSTSEGYHGALNDGTLPNIRLINPAQNQLEGRMLGWFYDGTWISSDPIPPWPPCNIPQTPDSTIRPLPAPFNLAAAQPSAFIAVPVGAVGGRIKTMGICN